MVGLIGKIKKDKNKLIQIFILFLLSLISSDIFASDRLKQLEQSLTNYEYGRPDSITKNWYVNCKIDKFNDLKKCEIFNQKHPISIHRRDKLYFVNIGVNNYPHTMVGIRIDHSKAIFGKNGVVQNQKLINQMKIGKIANIRYQKWPYQTDIDEEVSLEGFKEALSELDLN